MSDVPMTVHKHYLGFLTETTILSAPGSKPLCVAERNGSVYIWMLTTFSMATAEYRFLMIGTGFVLAPVNETYEYIGTVNMQNGMVMHVFRVLGTVDQL